MNHPNSSATSSPSRTTLKLKVSPRKSPPETKTPAITPPPNRTKLKPGAQWSDDYKERMQADMDALHR